MGEEGTQVVGVGWVLLQGRGEVVTLLVLRAQLSYGLIMQGNEKKKATGLLAAGSQSESGSTRMDRGSPRVGRFLQETSAVLRHRLHKPAVSPQRVKMVVVCSGVVKAYRLMVWTLKELTVHVTCVLLCRKLTKGDQFLCVGTTEEMYQCLRPASVSSLSRGR